MAKTAPRAGGTASAPIKTAAAPSVPTPVAADGGAETVVDAPGSSGAPVGVERILWHPSAEKRRAWLRVDGEETAREVREGERVGRYAVTRIDAGSVLFRSGSTELTRKLGAGLP